MRDEPAFGRSPFGAAPEAGAPSRVARFDHTSNHFEAQVLETSPPTVIFVDIVQLVHEPASQPE